MGEEERRKGSATSQGRSSAWPHALKFTGIPYTTSVAASLCQNRQKEMSSLTCSSQEVKAITCKGSAEQRGDSQCSWSLNLALTHAPMLALTPQLLCPRVLFLSPVTNSTSEAGIALVAEGCKASWCRRKKWWMWDGCFGSAVCGCYWGGKRGSSRQDDKAYPF